MGRVHKVDRVTRTIRRRGSSRVDDMKRPGPNMPQQVGGGSKAEGNSAHHVGSETACCDSQLSVAQKWMENMARLQAAHGSPGRRVVDNSTAGRRPRRWIQSTYPS